VAFHTEGPAHTAHPALHQMLVKLSAIPCWVLGRAAVRRRPGPSCRISASHADGGPPDRL